MELEIFNFIDRVIEKLEEMKIDLDIISREIEAYYEKVVEGSSEGYLNINSRVKSRHSLKEKILRYDYYNKYGTVETLFEGLSDLIGVRLECRFIEDEMAIYKFIKKRFNKKSDKYPGFFYNESNPYVLLELDGKQPKDQKNGIKMYRIDGKYISQNKSINYELQIKSLVNIFWSEIEHKVIYKNYNYIVADKFYKDIMNAIKNSLTTIDQQLLLISNHFDRSNLEGVNSRKVQLEQLLSKIIYDLFAARMKNNIGILVDFRKSCDTIVRYMARNMFDDESCDDNQNLLVIFDKINTMERLKDIDFSSQITFERPLNFEDQVSEEIGTFIQSTLNEQFQWNLFFRILFYIEPEDNAGDFENFIKFYKDSICMGIETEKLYYNLLPEEVEQIILEMMLKFARVFVAINSVELLYNTMIEKVCKVFNSVIDAIYSNIFDISEWKDQRDMYLQLLQFRLLSIFSMSIKAEDVLDLLEEVRSSQANIEIDKRMLNNIDKL